MTGSALLFLICETQRVGFLTAGDWEATNIVGYSNSGSDV